MLKDKSCENIKHPRIQVTRTYLRRYRFKSATHLATTAGLVQIVSMSETDDFEIDHIMLTS